MGARIEGRLDFTEPATLAEAQIHLADALAAIEAIDRDFQQAHLLGMEPHDLNDWRRRARSARMYLCTKRNLYHQWIEQYHRSAAREYQMELERLARERRLLEIERKQELHRETIENQATRKATRAEATSVETRKLLGTAYAALTALKKEGRATFTSDELAMCKAIGAHLARPKS